MGWDLVLSSILVALEFTVTSNPPLDSSLVREYSTVWGIMISFASLGKKLHCNIKSTCLRRDTSRLLFFCIILLRLVFFHVFMGCMT